MGWRVEGLADGESARMARTMEEAAASLPEEATVSLSLAVSAVLLERMRLPSTDREELGGMVVLQLEKTLPYSGDELTSGFDVIRQEGNECDAARHRREQRAARRAVRAVAHPAQTPRPGRDFRHPACRPVPLRGSAGAHLSRGRCNDPGRGAERKAGGRA